MKKNSEQAHTHKKFNCLLTFYFFSYSDFVVKLFLLRNGMGAYRDLGKYEILYGKNENYIVFSFFDNFIFRHLNWSDFNGLKKIPINTPDFEKEKNFNDALIVTYWFFNRILIS